MSKLTVAFLFFPLRWIETLLIGIPRRLVAWFRPGELFVALREILYSILMLCFNNVRGLLQANKFFLRLTGHAIGRPLSGLKKVPLTPQQFIASSRKLRLPITQADGQLPAFICVLATLLASVITMSPTVNDFWSEQTYPTVAMIDQKLLPLGVSIGPERESETPQSRPMIAVVFGRIMPDDTVEEDDVAKVEIDSDEQEAVLDESEIDTLGGDTRPVGWRKNSGADRERVSSRGTLSVPKGKSPEAYEIRD